MAASHCSRAAWSSSTLSPRRRLLPRHPYPMTHSGMLLIPNINNQKPNKMFRKTFPLAILAGICISIGCVVNLRVGGVAGAVLFAFGLTTVVYYGLKLYTGTAGFIRRQGDWGMLAVVLLGNIVGCLLSAWLISYPSIRRNTLRTLHWSGNRRCRPA